ncbi:hypothetical protein ACSNOB_02805 [Micromonospora sp. URMC 106]|uniref:hypothetical protein n=1 Tax=Micromonospora sp. URMC 106 TaxID=3423408 RepID=UPI003F1B0133
MPLMQAAAMSVAAVVAAVAVVRASRRRAAGDAKLAESPAGQDSAFAEAGIGGSSIPGGAAGREKERASSPAGR